MAEAIKIDGKKYPSMAEAARQLGWSVARVRKAIGKQAYITGKNPCKRGPAKGQITKPLTEEKFQQLIALIKIQCTEKEICSVLQMSVSALNYRISERKIKGIQNFHDLYKKYQDEGRASLRRRQLQIAHQGNPALLIFLGKQYLGQHDRKEVTGRDGGPIESVSLAPEKLSTSALKEILAAQAEADGAAKDEDPDPDT